jgi:hypothetical protein
VIVGEIYLEGSGRERTRYGPDVGFIEKNDLEEGREFICQVQDEILYPSIPLMIVPGWVDSMWLVILTTRVVYLGSISRHTESAWESLCRGDLGRL